MHERGFSQYALLWRELIGEAGRMPLETPKPLTTLRAALGFGPYFGIAAALFALAPVFLGRLSRRLYGTRLVGVGAVLLLLLANGYFLSGPVLDGFWPLCWIGLMAAALYGFAAGSNGLSLAAVGTAGLIRPDAWGFALLLLVLIGLVDREARRPAHLGVLLCVPAWVAYDVALTGDPLYSSRTLDAYQEVMGVPPVTFGTFWERLAADVSAAFLIPLLAAGALGLAVAMLRSARARSEDPFRWRAHLAGGGLVALSALGYWGLSAVGEGFLLHVRFFVLPVALLGFYALALPMEALDSWTARRGREAVAGVVRGGVACLALAVALSVGWIRTDPWTAAREAHRILLVQREARADAVDWLRDHWLHGGGALLTGRSLEVFAHRLGPEAAARMHFFRVVAEDRERLRSLERGAAVYIGHDIAGADNWFVFLRRGETARVTDVNVLFEPRVNLEYEGDVVGLIYTFGPAPPPEASPPGGLLNSSSTPDKRYRQ